MSNQQINFIQPKPRFKWPQFDVYKLKRFALPLGIFLFAGFLGWSVYNSFSQGNFLSARNDDEEGQVAGVQNCVEGQLPKEWLMKYFNTENECSLEVGGAEGDPDEDFLTNEQEQIFGTDPKNPDTDGDNAYDGEEVAFNQDPNGTGQLNASTQTTEDYLKSLGPEYEKYTEENIRKELEKMLEADREMVLDIPSEKELIITQGDSLTDFEKYYDAIAGLETAENWEIAEIESSLFEMAPEQLNHYVDKFNAVIGVYKETPVPARLVMIPLLRIAKNRAGIEMYELIRDEYKGGVPSERFWPEFFYQTNLITQATFLEQIAWEEVAKLSQSRGDF
ncbi:MAG: hypothetical protein Q8R08_02965 [bacterium]|nr:hypothetical protein [bacterium]